MAKQAKKVDTAKAILALRVTAFGRKANRRRGMNTKNVVQILRKGKERSERAKADPSVNPNVLPPGSKVRRVTEAIYENSLRFLETLEHNSGRDLTDLANVDPAKVYARMAKPWKGRKGREASAMIRSEHSRTLRERAVELRRHGLSEAEIGKRIDRDVRTVRRYLTGR